MTTPTNRLTELNLWSMWKDDNLRVATLAVVQELKYQYHIGRMDTQWEDYHVIGMVARQQDDYTGQELLDVIQTLYRIHVEDYGQRGYAVPLSTVQILDDIIFTWFDDCDRNATNLLMRNAYLEFCD